MPTPPYCYLLYHFKQKNGSRIFLLPAKTVLWLTQACILSVSYNADRFLKARALSVCLRRHARDVVKGARKGRIAAVSYHNRNFHHAEIGRHKQLFCPLDTRIAQIKARRQSRLLLKPVAIIGHVVVFNFSQLIHRNRQMIIFIDVLDSFPSACCTNICTNAALQCCPDFAPAPPESIRQAEQFVRAWK